MLFFILLFTGITIVSCNKMYHVILGSVFFFFFVFHLNMAKYKKTLSQKMQPFKFVCIFDHETELFYFYAFCLKTDVIHVKNILNKII